MSLFCLAAIFLHALDQKMVELTWTFSHQLLFFLTVRIYFQAPCQFVIICCCGFCIKVTFYFGWYPHHCSLFSGVPLVTYFLNSTRWITSNFNPNSSTWNIANPPVTLPALLSVLPQWSSVEALIRQPLVCTQYHNALEDLITLFASGFCIHCFTPLWVIMIYTSVSNHDLHFSEWSWSTLQWVILIYTSGRIFSVRPVYLS